ncbi:type I secretion C-terminal target domain (VC_A0849 subclass) [Clostridium sp. USBA 49]|uniref:hypothetical protein n=1 Tax=Clostridium sp. USBA 49 TaxID=1881060 RepID=UPI000999685C|nr:hypothetical protein [Clostridium sp. USBA 49]SKA75175.1 type I secretion C-terminal target domain (VC_A0849 subclass) [Clostridium sp. USBA 49]
MDLENKDTNIEKDTKENKTSTEETKIEDKNEEVVSIKKADLDALIEKVSKIGEIEKMLKNEQEEKKQLKFENLKQKHKLDNDLCELLNITADTKEEDIVKKVTKFTELAGGQQKDNAVFFKTDTTKSTTEDKIQQLIKEGKITEALALKLS